MADVGVIGLEGASSASRSTKGGLAALVHAIAGNAMLQLRFTHVDGVDSWDPKGVETQSFSPCNGYGLHSRPLPP
jgi:hypothetical protein